MTALIALVCFGPALGGEPVFQPVSGALSPDGPPGLGLRNSSCASCHIDEGAEHARSRHAVSATNPIFRAAFEAWPNGWCLGCHAPTAEAQIAMLGAPAVPGAFRPPSPQPEGAHEDGVGCVVCHVQDGLILSASPPTETGARAHPVRHLPELRSEALCARCHEFPFQIHTPRWPFALGDEPSQETITEWRSSHAAKRGISCVDCHMPQREHTFPGAHSQDLVREALSVRVKCRSDGIEAAISARAPHRIPTGDPFRRIELRLCLPGDCATPLHRAWLRRTHAPDATTFRLTSDTTIAPSAGRRRSRVRLVYPFDAIAPEPLSWELRLLYGDPLFEALLSPEEVGYTIASGSCYER